jgi:2-iminobutanoate/2-iminopropanoate deaminase
MTHAPTAVHTDAAPRAIGPYSQAVAAGGFLFVSGQIPLDPATGQLLSGDFEAEVDRVLANVDAVLVAAGSGRERVVKATIFVTDLSLFGTLNERYGKFFGEHRPARAVVQVSALPRGARLEMEAVAVF